MSCLISRCQAGHYALPYGRATAPIKGGDYALPYGRATAPIKGGDYALPYGRVTAPIKGGDHALPYGRATAPINGVRAMRSMRTRCPRSHFTHLPKSLFSVVVGHYP